MRRSAAPSQAQAAKRPRFAAPFKSTIQDSQSRSTSSNVSNVRQDISADTFHGQDVSTVDVIHS